jgi:hypothetical protein
MKSKLVAVCVTLLASATWWVGCSSTVVNSTADAGGSTPVEAGGQQETGPVAEAGTDAPADTGVDSASPLGPFVAITYGSCAAFTPCGGDPIGSFTVTGGCVGNGAFAAAKTQCPGIVESDVVIQARGTVVTDATTIVRDTEVKLAAKLFIPASCVTAAGGSCGTIEAGITFVGKLDTATCATDGAGGCNCNVGDTTAEKTTDTYTKTASSITTGTGATERTFDYCITGNELQYLETTANSVPATYVLTK